MSGNKDKTISKRGPTSTEINFAKLAIDLDSDHEYDLTKTTTTTETYKLTKSASKSKGKQVEAARSRRHSSPSQPSSSKATPRKPLSPPSTRNQLFDRLTNQFNDRATQEPSNAGYAAWRALVADVKYLRHNYIYIESRVAHQQASQLIADLEGVLHEAEFGSDVVQDTRSLRKGASKGASRETVKDIRNEFLKSWGKTVRMWRAWLHDVKVEKAEMIEEHREREKLKEQEKKKQEEKQKQEEIDKAKKVRFNFLGPFS